MTTNPIITRILTEKSTNLEKGNTFVFEVDVTATKYTIGLEIQRLYGERPKSVRVVTRPGQTRRVGKLRREICTPARKIAYVTTTKPLESLKQVSA